MDRKFTNDIFENDISIEEFDHITDGVEDHVFSKEYLARKESMMNNTTKAKISNLRIKVAAAACAVVVASPFVVNAAMDGALFNSIWGNEGKTDVPVHQITYVEDGKITEINVSTTMYFTVVEPGRSVVESEGYVILPNKDAFGNMIFCSPGDKLVFESDGLLLTSYPLQLHEPYAFKIDGKASDEELEKLKSYAKPDYIVVDNI